MKACRVHVSGIVQGVGFRPWVWSRARSLGLAGWVRNDTAGVEMHLEGPPEAIDAMMTRFAQEAPPLARVEAATLRPCAALGVSDFRILESHAAQGDYLPVAPDVCVCDDCLAEMRNPADRRYRYPFINCTNCGPRFTIVADVPYDRANTTMAAFEMCPQCRREYEDPADRRFHAQPVACPACGPCLRLERAGRPVTDADEAMRAARDLLAAGAVLAVKGLGGFHLACDASNPGAVARLREGKRREARPFALMSESTVSVRRHAHLGATHQRLLESRERPVVLLPARADSTLAPGVAPGRDHLGFMLPYTPLHYLLTEPAPGHPDVLVMTSANLSDEPIAYQDEDARRRLAPLADAFLMHDRPIRMRTDDSVLAVFEHSPYLLRRSRGYAPLPLRLPLSGPSVLAAGAEMKNAFCLTRDDRAFLSHHIGEMGTLETLRSFEDGVRHFERIFRTRPQAVAHDLHPDYSATRAALDRAAADALPTIAVQHHHAHIASCMADNGLSPDARVIGVCFDGAGYGPDGAVWGGEFLLCGYAAFERLAHLRYMPLPGADAATRNPFRTALAALRQAGLAWADDLAPVRAAGDEELAVISRQLSAGINAPPTSSVGRLFDAFASLLGVCHRATCEAQAAAELEAVARSTGDDDSAYPFALDGNQVDPAPALRRAVEDLRRGTPPAPVARRFHVGLAQSVAECCRAARDATGIGAVALSGGVWQNLLLLGLTVAVLRDAGFTVLLHRQAPANDGGIALGQASVALARLRAEAPALAPQENAACA